MNRIGKTFARPRVLLPVVHPVSRDRALAAVDVAVSAGADGVFLIDQGLNEREVVALIAEVYRRHPARTRDGDRSRVHGRGLHERRRDGTRR